jgi:hypothetical protein
MNESPTSPDRKQENAMHLAERRTIDRTHNAPWPDAMRDELRKVQFLHAVEVEEVDGDSWSDIFEAFERRHIRFI